MAKTTPRPRVLETIQCRFQVIGVPHPLRDKFTSQMSSTGTARERDPLFLHFHFDRPMGSKYVQVEI